MEDIPLQEQVLKSIFRVYGNEENLDFWLNG